MGFPGGSDSKESTCNVGDPGWVPGWGRSHFSILVWRIPMDKRNLVGCNLWGQKESDTTEWLSMCSTLRFWNSVLSFK